MGSVLSFPILCILSLTAYLLSLPQSLTNTILKDWKELKALSGVGINGDDVVFTSDMEGFEEWVQSVKRIGGVVSRGKTLLNAHYFTVNSELWHRANGKVNVLRPSLLTALTGDNRYYINPAVDYLEFTKCEIVNDEMAAIFNLDERLKLSIPTSYGGLGLIHSFNPRVHRAARIEHLYQKALLGPRITSARGIRHNHNQELIMKALGPKIEVFVTKKTKEKMSSVFTHNHRSWNLDMMGVKNALISLHIGESTFEPFREALVNYRPTSREIISRTYKEIDLEADYNLRMRGKSAKIPLSLLPFIPHTTPPESTERLLDISELPDHKLEKYVQMQQRIRAGDWEGVKGLFVPPTPRPPSFVSQTEWLNMVSTLPPKDAAAIRNQYRELLKRK